VVVEATKHGRSLRWRWAENVVEEIEVAVGPEGSEVGVDVTLPDTSGIRNGRVDLTITVPEETDVDLMNGAGQTRIVSTAGTVRVRSERGTVRMEGVRLEGGYNVMNTTGDVHVQGHLPEPGSGLAWGVPLRTARPPRLSTWV
jgi:hypothetical protein